MFKKAMTGNGVHIPPINMVMTGDGLWHCFTNIHGINQLPTNWGRISQRSTCRLSFSIGTLSRESLGTRNMNRN